MNCLSEKLFFQLDSPALVSPGCCREVTNVCTLQDHLHHTTFLAHYTRTEHPFARKFGLLFAVLYARGLTRCKQMFASKPFASGPKALKTLAIEGYFVHYKTDRPVEHSMKRC